MCFAPQKYGIMLNVAKSKCPHLSTNYGKHTGNALRPLPPPPPGEELRLSFPVYELVNFVVKRLPSERSVSPPYGGFRGLSFYTTKVLPAASNAKRF